MAASTDPGHAIYRGQQISMVVVSVLMCFFGVSALILRIIGRFLVVQKLGPDDLLMIGGMVCTGGFLFELLYGLRFNIGLHGPDHTPTQMIGLLKIIYAIQLTYNTVIFLVKLSIVSFYLRLATFESKLRKHSWLMIIFLVLFYTSSQLATTFSCMPIESNWDISGKGPKNCFDTEVYFYVLAVINIIVDIVILILPIQTLKAIKRERRDKIVLFIIFGIGAFSCISSIIRLYTIHVFATSKDPFYDGVPINTWSMIEINVAVVCASVPAMKPLFTKTIRQRLASSRAGRTGYVHQMVPLGSKERGNNRIGRFREGMSGYSANATAGSDSLEYIVTKGEGVECEREVIDEHRSFNSHVGPKMGRELAGKEVI